MRPTRRGRTALCLFACASALVLAACGGHKAAPSPSTDARAVQVACPQSFAPTAAMRQAIVDGQYVDIGPLTLVRFRQLAAQRPIGAKSLKVLVIATPGASVRVTIDARDRGRAGFLRFPARDVDPLPADTKPRFEIAGCTKGRLTRRSLGYAMTWAVASPGCVHFTVVEQGAETKHAAVPFGSRQHCS